MANVAQIVVDLDPDLRDAFLDAAKAEERPASEIVQEFIEDYVHSRDPASDYYKFLERKVAKARESIRAGKGIPNAEVEAEFAKRRAAILSRDA